MPKFNLALDSQQINEFMTCPLLWYYKHRENIRLATSEQKVAADKGSLVHWLMEKYYTERALNPTGNQLIQASDVCIRFKVEKITESLFPKCYDKESDDFGLEDFICDRFMLYIQRYLVGDFRILCKDNKPAVEVGFSTVIHETNTVRFILEGRMDALTEIVGNGAWVDHKTEGKYNPLYSYKTQFRTYALATGFRYGIVNYFGMQEDKKGDLLKAGKLFRRELITFSQEMIDEWREKIIKHVFWPIWAGLNEYKNENPEKDFYAIKNESACSGAFDTNPCQFTYLCEEMNWDFKQKIKEFKYKKVEQWTPWKLEEVTK